MNTDKFAEGNILQSARSGNIFKVIRVDDKGVLFQSCNNTKIRKNLTNHHRFRLGFKQCEKLVPYEETFNGESQESI